VENEAEAVVAGWRRRPAGQDYFNWWPFSKSALPSAEGTWLEAFHQLFRATPVPLAAARRVAAAVHSAGMRGHALGWRDARHIDLQNAARVAAAALVLQDVGPSRAVRSLLEPWQSVLPGMASSADPSS
jgi:hypothetical protein